jgi:hypothetical protein
MGINYWRAIGLLKYLAVAELLKQVSEELGGDK